MRINGLRYDKREAEPVASPTHHARLNRDRIVQVFAGVIYALEGHQDHGAGKPSLLGQHIESSGADVGYLIGAWSAAGPVIGYDSRQRLPGTALVMMRVMGLLLLYNTAVLMVLASFTRYSIPFLPLVFGMGPVGALLLWQGAAVA